MVWLDDVLKTEYSIFKVLKNTEEKSIIVYRNNTLEKCVVCRRFTGTAEVYEKLQKIKAENLPEVYNVSKEDNEINILEEYIDGITVGEVLQSGLYNENGVKKVVGSLCDALYILHSMGIVHRDIKPENVMITNNGVVKLIDFDAARVFKCGKSADTAIIGTVGYAAPEQMGFAQSDERTDIYALGVLMNVMLTGEHPGKRIHKGRYKKIIEKAININPEKRFQSASELKKYL